MDTKVDELSAMIQYMFRSVFVHRYRFNSFLNIMKNTRKIFKNPKKSII